MKFIVTVEFVGPLRRPSKERKMTLDLDPGATIEHLLSRLGYSPFEIDRIAVLRNDKQARKEDALDDGDRISLLLPMGGGSLSDMPESTDRVAYLKKELS